MRYSPIQVRNLRIENLINPLGVEEQSPTFSWGFHIQDESLREQKQTGYRITVASKQHLLKEARPDMWDSGKVTSIKHSFIPYEGKPLQSNTKYFWEVQIWDGEDLPSNFSETAFWSMGLLKEQDWAANWIGLTDLHRERWKAIPGMTPTLMPLLRHEFALGAPIVQAFAYVCGLGQYEFRVNGKKVGDYVLEPGWTDYDHSCLYMTYDISSMLTQGENAVGLMLGNGFYNIEGDRYLKYKGGFGLPKAIVQIEIELADGNKVRVLSGEQWMIGPSPITFSCVYGGEDYDARLQQSGWDLPKFLSSEGWGFACEVEPPKGKLSWSSFQQNKVMEVYPPINITEPVTGIYVYDFGKNFSGWPLIQVNGPTGSTLKLIPGELLDDEGLVNQKWTGSPVSFSYTLQGAETENWHPRFSYYGFRYIQIEVRAPENASDEHGALPVLKHVEGQMIFPELQVSGHFESSKQEWNRIHSIITRSILSNTKSVFTDCPHREKLGWLEEVHLMGPSIWYNYDVSSLLVKIFKDMREAQLENGMVPDIAPEYVVFENGFRDSPEWGSAVIITPWYFYNWYGKNIKVLKQHYDSMKKYVDYLKSTSVNNIVRHGLGDWGDIGPNPGFPHHTPIPVTATALYYYDCVLLSRIAEQLGKEEDMEKYKTLSDQIRTAFNQEFFNNGASTYASGSQTSNAIPLALGLTTSDTEELALSALIGDLKAREYAVTSGEIGHRFALLGLTKKGRSDVIMQMLKQSAEPYYEYQVAHGATSLTEFWDGPTVGMSQNHFMMGHIEEWFYSTLAGIQIDYEGINEHTLTIQPYLAEGIDWVKADQIIPAGRVEIEWRRTASSDFSLNLLIPPQTDALVRIPLLSHGVVTESGQQINESKGIDVIKYSNQCVELQVSSGRYQFLSK